MTNNEAIEYLKGQIKCLKCETGIDCEKCIMPNWSKEIEIEALNKGIEAIENQKIGHWIENAPEWQNIDPPYICSECGNFHLRKTNYCDQCGAKMIEQQK